MQRLNRFCGHLSATPAPQAPLVASPISGKKKPLNVLVTGAAGNIGYSIVFMIAQGCMLGPDQPVEIRLLDIPPMAKVLKGLTMELQDGAFPLLHRIVDTTDYKVAFGDVDVALLIGSKPRAPGMQRKDLLRENAGIFVGQGKALDQLASRNVKVLVVGNPANTNALVAQQNAPSLPASAFSAMTRLDQNRAQALLAGRLNVNVGQVKNVIIWGNHSTTQYPDIRHAYVQDYPSKGARTSVKDAIRDDAWLDGPFITAVQQRGAAILEARQKSSAASAASAAVDHVRSWVLGSEGEYVSMGIVSDGSYDIPRGLVFSYPCVTKNGSFSIVPSLSIDGFSREKLKITTAELLEEKAQALGS